MHSISRLLNPRSIAVVGASPRGGRAGRTLVNLRETGFRGEVFGVNPRYEEAQGFKCYPSIDAVPPVDCLVIGINADAACETLERALARGIDAAVVLAAGFGEGGQNEGRVARLLELSRNGMSICGPNCYGLLSIKEGATATAYSGRIPEPLRPGCVALVSQSGGLANSVYAPLMTDRELGFRYVVSCGNQIGTTIEDYVDYFARDPDVRVIAAIVEQFKNPRKLLQAARRAHEQGKPIIAFQAGRSAAGQVMIRSHTGALVSDGEIVSALLRRAGIMRADTYDEFVESIELLAASPRNAKVSREVIVVSGSGGGAAIAADALEGSGMRLAAFTPAAAARIRTALPDFGTVTNPIDGTGAMSDDPALLQNLFAALLADGGDAMIATTVTGRGSGNEKERRFAKLVAEAARTTGRAMAAFQHSPLGGPLDAEIVRTLHSANVPFLLGGTNAMRALKFLPAARECRDKVLARTPNHDARADVRMANTAAAAPARWDFLTARVTLAKNGVSVTDAGLATSEDEAVGLARRFGTSVAVKAEAPGLLHKSDVGCVRLGLADEEEVRAGFRAVVQNAKKAGCARVDGALIQPMIAGVAEAYAGIINDPLFGPAICVGLGGVFVEIFKDTATELAPLTHADALDMIGRLKASPILAGARGRKPGDIAALADFLVRLGDFAVDNFGRFRALDLNPVIVRRAGEGVVAVDIAVEPFPGQAGAEQVAAVSAA